MSTNLKLFFANSTAFRYVSQKTTIKYFSYLCHMQTRTASINFTIFEYNHEWGFVRVPPHGFFFYKTRSYDLQSISRASS